MSAGRTLVTMLAAAGVARIVRALPDPSIGGWQRSNFRGRPVSLSGGLAVAAGALAGSAISSPFSAASLLAAGSAVAAGGYDDLAAARVEQARDKGLGGHLRALASGRLSGGAVKVATIGAGSILAARALARRGDRVGWPASLANAALIAGSANLLNLFDVRPGRAGKIVLVSGAIAGLSGGLGGPVGAAVGAMAAVLPDDLAETTMLGDLGANTAGALIGVRLAAASTPVRIGAAAVIATLTLVSERVSFSKVIDSVPALHCLDQLGRQPDTTSTPSRP